MAMDLMYRVCSRNPLSPVSLECPVRDGILTRSISTRARTKQSPQSSVSLAFCASWSCITFLRFRAGLPFGVFNSRGGGPPTKKVFRVWIRGSRHHEDNVHKRLEKAIVFTRYQRCGRGMMHGSRREPGTGRMCLSADKDIIDSGDTRLKRSSV